MTSIWLESIIRSLEDGLDLLAAAVGECPDRLWVSSMWAVPADLFGTSPPGQDGVPVTDLAARTTLVQARSAPWSVAWHALECLDYDLTGELGPWTPPPPFAGTPHWRMTTLRIPWRQSEILDYIEYCRGRVRDTLGSMTLEGASRLLPDVHRYRGQPHARIITSAIGHTVEHGSQIRQFITLSGEVVQ